MLSKATKGVVGLILVLAGCGDPGPASRQLALLTTQSGELVVQFIGCPEEMASQLEIIEGDDPWRTPRWQISLDPPQSQVYFSLDEAPDQFNRGDAVSLSELTVPFSVQIANNEGLVGSAVFDQKASPGMAVIASEDEILGSTVEVPEREVAGIAKGSCQ